MNVLLIYPAFPNTFWSFTYALKFVGKKAAYPPLGLLTVAAMLPEEFHKRLVDVNTDKLTEDDLAWADMAFIGGMAIQRESAKHIIARCKARGLKVIAGGPLFTAEADEFGEVDHLVLDEAELTLPIFLEDLKNGHPRKIYRASGFCDLSSHPDPRLGSGANAKICVHEHSVFQRVPVQLRFLQCHDPFRPSGTHEDPPAGTRRVGQSLCGRLAQQHLLCGRQFYRKQGIP